MELRPTAAGDLPALHRLFLDSIADVYRSRRLEPPAPPLGVFVNQQGHVLATGTSLLVETNRRPLGFASAWSRGGDWFLASLFVAPQAQHRGVGTALLETIFGERAERRRTITDAIQPVSNRLYLGRGLVPMTPVLTFAGRPVVTAEVGPAPASIAEVDLAAYGFDRAVDHAYWALHARRGYTLA